MNSILRFACYNCINGITSTADEYNFTSYNCIRNNNLWEDVEEDYPVPVPEIAIPVKSLPVSSRDQVWRATCRRGRGPGP